MVNAYLTKSKISSTISPTTIKIKKPYAYATSRISHINTTTIPQSMQKSLQLINCNSIYLRSKLSPPPIDITRKFSIICLKNENSTNIPMINMADKKQFNNGRYQNDKMEILQLNIPWRKIFSTTQQNHSTITDIAAISYDNQINLDVLTTTIFVFHLKNRIIGLHIEL
uniref:Uncharacterized protein n=1 Tax=Wuchereria bancrofti TaxID=6293 RepID=A0A1I8EWF7_WUCBA